MLGGVVLERVFRAERTVNMKIDHEVVDIDSLVSQQLIAMSLLRITK